MMVVVVVQVVVVVVVVSGCLFHVPARCWCISGTEEDSKRWLGCCCCC